MHQKSQPLEQLYREHSGKMLAYLVSLTNNLSLAEEIWHDTLEAALPLWQSAPPANPIAWLYRVARNKTIDRMRHQKMSLQKGRLVQALAIQDEQEVEPDWDELQFGDEQLKLIFACCHPALDIDKQIPLTLSTICGLNSLQIADALVLQKSTLEQRLTRAKRKLKTAAIPFIIPQQDQLQERLAAVLKTIYLVFNAADQPDNDLESDHIDLSTEALRLTKNLRNLLPEQPEISGLQALMLFHLARRKARYNSEGQLILLEHQDRTLWDQKAITKADDILRQALSSRKPGSYQIQAAIQGVHCLSKTSEETDWLHIEGLYYLLMEYDANPVIKLNAAVATSMSRDIESALRQIEVCERIPQLQKYSLLYGAKADMYFRLHKFDMAKANYETARSLSNKVVEQEFYRRKIAELESQG